jgi:hypothetical protein
MTSVLRMAAATVAVLGLTAAIAPPASAQTATSKPNILYTMGDDIGWMQRLARHQHEERLEEDLRVRSLNEEGANRCP